MFEDLTSSHKDALDDILKARRSVRAFSPIPPSRDEVEQIIRAGLIAPFASLPAKGKTDFRKIIVMSTSSSNIEKVKSIIKANIPKITSEMENDPKLSTPEKNFFGSIDVDKIDNRLFSNAPYLIIAAERKGFPPTYMADQSISLSYCMYSMWLKATSLKIGFRLVSLFVHLRLGNDKEFCQLLGIPTGEYAIDACVIGYPAEGYRPQSVNYPDFDSNVKWL